MEQKDPGFPNFKGVVFHSDEFSKFSQASVWQWPCPFLYVFLVEVETQKRQVSERSSIWGVCNPSLSPHPFCKMGVRCPSTVSSASLQNHQLSTKCPTQRLCRQGAGAWRVQQGQSRDGIRATWSYPPPHVHGWLGLTAGAQWAWGDSGGTIGPSQLSHP